MGLLQMCIATWLLLIHLLVETNATYYGKLISRDWGSNSAITGDVYAIDNNTIQVINFSYNSDAGCSGFYLVQSSNPGGTNLAALPVSGEPTGPLRSFTGEDVVLEDLPDGSVLTDYTHLVLYHPLTQYECGRVLIPVLFVAPAPQAIGQFSSRAHAVRSGEVTVLNDRQIEIKAFRYDGQGPDAFFYVGVTDRVQLQAAPYGKIPDENGDSDKPGAYSDKDIILTLPASMSVTELKWLSMYGILFAHNFGEVFFPADLNVPPYKEPVVNPADFSCEALSDELQISWRISGDEIIMELAGNIDRYNDYMSFGLSGSTSSYNMIGSDVVVVDWIEGRQPNAVDYHINQYAQCNGRGSGVCADTSNDVRVVSSRITDGITRVKYSRKLVTSDTTDDKDYKVDGTAQQIVWSIGPLYSNGEAAKHYPNKRTSESKTINFGRPPVDNCPSFITTTESPRPAFKPHHIYGRPGKSTFTAEIGPSAANQGYTALTGRPSWGIVWYIDGTLIPELHLKRGVSYKFNVYGGIDRRNTAKYHPFYITDNPVGGYSQSRNGTIYPAVISRRGRIQRRQRAVGTYCEWKLTQQAIAESADGKSYQCFEEMKRDLVKQCDADPLRKTTFVWTPNASTPDLVYYQCWKHTNLGWKIHVYDELPSTDIQPETCEPAATRK